MLTQEQIDRHVIFSKDNPALGSDIFPRKYLNTKWLLCYETGKKKKLSYHVKLKLDTSLEGYVYYEHTTNNFLEALQFNNMEETFKMGLFCSDSSDFKLIEIITPDSFDQSNN